MKALTLLVLLVTGAICTVTVTADIHDNFCKYKPDGEYRDPYDACRGFIHCHNYNASYKPCPGGLLYNETTKQCDWPRNVDCPMGNLDCGVGIVGGGFSGLYHAYQLLKTGKETSVCVFEEDSRLGGRIWDHAFKEAPNVAVGLGAWRIDKKHPVMIKHLAELEISHVEWSFIEPSLIESRGIVANNHEDIKKAFPYLKAHRKFGPMSSSELLSYALKPEHAANAESYATVNTYVSNHITHEGAEYLSELYGYKGDYTDFISPRSYMEFTEMSLKLADKYIRPVGGMSTIITVLKQRIEALGGKIYTSTAVKTIEREGDIYVLMTPSLRVQTPKLVIAVPPVQFEEINGSVAKRIHDSPQFRSIQPIPAFKGAAVYDKAWWESVNVAGKPITPGQKFISSSNCLGTTLAHRDKGPSGAGVLHTLYSDGECARQWADIAKLQKHFLDTEVHRALEAKFNTTIPKPRDSAYHYWDSAWHFQKPGTTFSMEDISNWAKRPFPGENLFIIGEAFHPFRGWCEGSIVSSQNALQDGWGLTYLDPSARFFGHARTEKEDVSEMAKTRKFIRA
ncbi:uncharacterized protein LOC116602233 [Nematostella vectensis]|uniref:uncharacterized protein LOC116602233 n=1 Tax=Nematostella vectensis TaxID=45351 RepID=UPI0020777FA0|nr:uncharacterized protein LOC116602233 [Nematostella vectensis]